MAKTMQEDEKTMDLVQEYLELSLNEDMLVRGQLVETHKANEDFCRLVGLIEKVVGREVENTKGWDGDGWY